MISLDVLIELLYGVMLELAHYPSIVRGGDREPEVLMSILEGVIAWHQQQVICLLLHDPITVYVLFLLVIEVPPLTLLLNKFLLLPARLLHFVLELLVFDMLMLSKLLFKLLVVTPQPVAILSLFETNKIGKLSLLLNLIDLSLDLFFSVLEQEVLHTLTLIWGLGSLVLRGCAALFH